MKKFIAFSLALICFLNLCGCNQSVEKNQNSDAGITNPEKEQDQKINTISLIRGVGYAEEYDADTNDVVIKATYPAVYTYYEDENKYSGLSEVFGDRYKSIKEKQLKFISENRSDAANFYRDMGEAFRPMEAAEDVSVRRADTLVTSLLYHGELYFGGAHGTPFMWGESYDTQSGRRLALSDVVEDMGKLYDAVEEQLGVFWSDLVRENAMSVEEVLANDEYASWTVDYNGITFWFNPYTIANYPNGIQTVTVSNSEYPDVLKDEYKKVPDAYGVELISDSAFYYDINDDGKTDELLVYSYENDNEGNAGAITIYINGKSYDEEYFQYGTDAIFVKTEDGKKYILIETLLGNDYREMTCYDISGEVKKIGTVEGGLKRIYHEGDIVVTHQVLTNPGSFCMQQTTQLLSTATGYKEYYVGNNGIPVSDDKIFAFDEERFLTFTVLQDFEADVYDEKTDKVKEKKTLKSGEEVYYVGTDNEKYAYLKAVDGTLIRVEVVSDKESWKHTINGIDTEEVFEGLLYAG